MASAAFYGQNGTLALRVHISDSISICGCAVAEDFTQDRSVPSSRVLQFLQDNGCGTFRHDEAVTLAIKGAGCCLWCAVAFAQGLDEHKADKTDEIEVGFSPAGDHNVATICLDAAVGFSDGLGSGGTGRNHREVAPLAVVQHRQQSTANVGFAAKEIKAGIAGLVGKALEVPAVIFGIEPVQHGHVGDHRVFTVVAKGQADPAAVGDFLQSGQFNRFAGRNLHQLHAPRSESVQSGGNRFRDDVQPFVLDLTADAAGKAPGVKGTDEIDAGTPLAGVFKGFSGVFAEGSDHPVAGDHNPAFSRCFRHGLQS